MRDRGTRIDDVQRSELDISCERRVVQNNVARFHGDSFPVSGDRGMDEVWERQTRVLAKALVQWAQPRWLADGDGPSHFLGGLREPLIGSVHSVPAHRLGNGFRIGGNVAKEIPRGP